MTSTDVQRTAPPFSLRPYTANTYAYPHKTAYRPLEVVRKLEDVWSAEDLADCFCIYTFHLRSSLWLLQFVHGGLALAVSYRPNI